MKLQLHFPFHEHLSGSRSGTAKMADFGLSGIAKNKATLGFAKPPGLEVFLLGKFHHDLHPAGWSAPNGGFFGKGNSFIMTLIQFRFRNYSNFPRFLFGLGLI